MNVERLHFSPEPLLLDMLRRGSTHAFDELYRLYARRLMGFCMQLCRSREDAEEIVQDAFVQLWRHREQIRQTDSLRAFLFTTARNKIINAYRTLASSATYEDYIDYLDALGEEEAGGRFSYEEFVQQLDEALGELPPAQARILRLSRLEDMSNKDIASHLGLSEQTVKNQLSLGLRSLRSKLSERGYLAILFLLSLWDF